MLQVVTSDAAAGSTSATISIGAGLFEIDTLSIIAGLTTDEAQSVHIRVRRKQSDGTYKDVEIAAGYFTPKIPFVLHNVRFEGPALVVTYAFHMETTSHTLSIDYRRIAR